MHTTDRLTEAPTVEYSVTLQEGHGRVDVSIQNLSYATRFENLEFSLDCQRDDCGEFKNGQIVGSPPAFHGGSKPDTRQGSEFVFTIPSLQPGGQFLAYASFAGSELPTLRLKSANAPVWLLESSFLTFILRHQLGFILAFSAISLCVVAWLLYITPGMRQEDRRV